MAPEPRPEPKVDEIRQRPPDVAPGEEVEPDPLWRLNEQALRRGEPMPRSALPHVLVYGILVFAVAASIAVIIHLA